MLPSEEANVDYNTDLVSRPSASSQQLLFSKPPSVCEKVTSQDEADLEHYYLDDRYKKKNLEPPQSLIKKKSSGESSDEQSSSCSHDQTANLIAHNNFKVQVQKKSKFFAGSLHKEEDIQVFSFAKPYLPQNKQLLFNATKNNESLRGPLKRYRLVCEGAILGKIINKYMLYSANQDEDLKFVLSGKKASATKFIVSNNKFEQSDRFAVGFLKQRKMQVSKMNPQQWTLFDGGKKYEETKDIRECRKALIVFEQKGSASFVLYKVRESFTKFAMSEQKSLAEKYRQGDQEIELLSGVHIKKGHLNRYPNLDVNSTPSQHQNNADNMLETYKESNKNCRVFNEKKQVIFQILKVDDNIYQVQADQKGFKELDIMGVCMYIFSQY